MGVLQADRVELHSTVHVFINNARRCSCEFDSGVVTVKETLLWSIGLVEVERSGVTS